MIFQKTPSQCSCLLCEEGCMCGDCSGCTNATYDKVLFRNAKRAAALACLALVIGGFMFFAPVVTLRSEVPVTTGVVSFRINTIETSSTELCSITYCYLGQGAVYSQGVYYPVTKFAGHGIQGDRRSQL